MKESFASVNIELKFVITCCKIAIGESINIPLDFFLGQKDMDWKKVGHLSKLHCIRPLFLKGLESIERKELIPVEILRKLKKVVRQITLRNLLNQQELLPLLRNLDKDKIRAVPYKGNVLSQLLYGEPFLRESSDIDLFIFRKDFFRLKDFFKAKNVLPEYNLSPKAEHWLLKINCEFNYGYSNKAGYRFHIEPHHKSSHALEGIDLFLEDLESQIIKQEFQGQMISCFNKTASLLLIILNHGITERWERLKYLIDLHQFIQRFQEEVDWKWLDNQLKKYDLEKTFYSGLYIVMSLFETSIPHRFEEQLKDRKIKQLAVERLDFLNDFEKVNLKSELKTLRYRMKSRTKLSSKLKILFRTFTLPTAKDLKLLQQSDKYRFWFPILRPLRIMNDYLFSRQQTS